VGITRIPTRPKGVARPTSFLSVDSFALPQPSRGLWRWYTRLKHRRLAWDPSAEGPWRATDMEFATAWSSIWLTRASAVDQACRKFGRALHSARSFGLVVGCWQINSMERLHRFRWPAGLVLRDQECFPPSLSNQCAANVAQDLQTREFFEVFEGTSESSVRAFVVGKRLIRLGGQHFLKCPGIYLYKQEVADSSPALPTISIRWSPNPTSWGKSSLASFFGLRCFPRPHPTEA
jgi:hypothetical protein